MEVICILFNTEYQWSHKTFQNYTCVFFSLWRTHNCCYKQSHVVLKLSNSFQFEYIQKFWNFYSFQSYVDCLASAKKSEREAEMSRLMYCQIPSKNKGGRNLQVCLGYCLCVDMYAQLSCIVFLEVMVCVEVYLRDSTVWVKYFRGRKNRPKPPAKPIKERTCTSPDRRQHIFKKLHTQVTLIITASHKECHIVIK